MSILYNIAVHKKVNMIFKICLLDLYITQETGALIAKG